MECHESTSDYKEESNDSIDVLMQESNSGFDEANSCGKNAPPVTEGTKTGCALMTDAELGMKSETLRITHIFTPSMRSLHFSLKQYVAVSTV
jgi:hypothetical protein